MRVIKQLPNAGEYLVQLTVEDQEVVAQLATRASLDFPTLLKTQLESVLDQMMRTLGRVLEAGLEDKLKRASVSKKLKAEELLK